MSATDELAHRLLVIACGNPLRCDDGIAWHVADEIPRELTSTKIICVHQLAPELAEEASRADAVIFIDATRNGEPGKVSFDAVSPDFAPARFSHHLAPAQILALCSRLYGVDPRGFLISICGDRFDHGTGLSPAAISAIPQSLAAVMHLARDFLGSYRPPSAS